MSRSIFKKKNMKGKLAMIIFIAIFATIIYGFNFIQHKLGETDNEKRTDFVQSAIIRSAVQCYALETRYPPSLKYLQEHYGLILDNNKYIYYYQSQGDNRMPVIKVLSVN
jgi:hypothetical protein